MSFDDVVSANFKEEQLTESRARIPKYGADLVGAPALNLSKFAAPLVAALGVIVTGLSPVLGLGDFPKFADIDDELAKVLLALGFMFVVAAAILSVTIAFAADMKARGVATAASLRLRAQVPLTMAPPGAPGESAGLWVKREGRGDDEQFLVIAGHRTQADVTQYLLARGDDTPEWVNGSDITAWEVKVSRPSAKPDA